MATEFQEKACEKALREYRKKIPNEERKPQRRRVNSPFDG